MKHGNKKHGLTGTPFYRSWFSMKSRCANKNDSSYKNYGARGITYSPEWESFNSFYNDMWSTYKKGLTIDRINNNEGYSKDNCRWATMKEQNNNRRNNNKITIKGITKNLLEWLEYYKLDHNTYYGRVRNGWDIIDALTTRPKIYKKYIDYNGNSKTLGEWAEYLDVDYKTLYRRLYIKKYPLNKALTSEKFDGKKVI